MRISNVAFILSHLRAVIISSKYGSVEALAHFNLSLSDNEAENRKFKRVRLVPSETRTVTPPVRFTTQELHALISVVARSLNIAPEEVATVLSEESESNQALHP